MSSVGLDSDHGPADLDLPPDLARFLADLAHQLRNPAFAISASVEALESEPGGTTASVFLDTIRNETARLARLASDLQAYIEPVQVARDTAEVEALVATALDQVRPMATARDVSLGSAAGWTGPRRRCDASALLRALVALLEHAVLRSRPGSTVRLSLERRTEAEKRWLELTIADSGAAYKEDALPTILRPFAARGAGVSGLGLAIAARVAAAHAGRVEVTNAEAAGGGLARLVLPLTEEAS